MYRTEKEEFIIGAISLLSNGLTRFGDGVLPEITFRQWFLLMLISRMDEEEKSINSIAEYVGTTRQNVKKMLTSLEAKGYVAVSRSRQDASALKVELTQKAYQYLADYDEPLANETNRLFLLFSDEEIESFVSSLKKLRQSLENYEEGE